MSKLSATLPAQTAAGATSVTTLGVWEPEYFQSDTIEQIILLPPSGYTTVTGVATNNFTVNFRQMRNVAGTDTVISTFATITFASGTNLVAEIPLNVAIASQPMFQAGDVVDVQLVQNASGLALNANVVASVFVN